MAFCSPKRNLLSCSFGSECRWALFVSKTTRRGAVVNNDEFDCLKLFGQYNTDVGDEWLFSNNNKHVT